MAQDNKNLEQNAELVFHDIKPLETFHPLPINSLVFALLLLAIFIVYYLWRKNKNRASSIEKVLTPKELAFERLGELERYRQQNKILLREFSSRLSLTNRAYLESIFDFNACELTVSELSQEISKHLSKKLYLTSSETTAEINERIKKCLKFLELVSFADKSSEKFRLDSPEILSVLQESHLIIKDIEQELEKQNKDQGSKNGI